MNEYYTLPEIDGFSIIVKKGESVWTLDEEIIVLNDEDNEWILSSLKRLRGTVDYDSSSIKKEAANRYIYLGLNNGQMLLTLSAMRGDVQITVYFDKGIMELIDKLIELYEHNRRDRDGYTIAC